MKSFMSICLDKSSKIPIYKQLGDALLHLIDDEILEVDSKLPPIRRMAKDLKINSSTVVNAYKYLESKHAVYSFLGSGTFVSPKTSQKEAYINKKQMFKSIISPTKITADLTGTRLPDKYFPGDEIKNAFSQALDLQAWRVFLNENSPNGYEPLLDIIYERLAAEICRFGRGCLYITEDNSPAYELIARLIITKGDYVVAENPVGFDVIAPYIARGANILHTPILRDGIDLSVTEALFKKYKPKALHISTYFQTPVSLNYSAKCKKELLDLCYRYNVLVVESDNLSDLIYKEKKVFLKSLDYKNQVIYVKNITKTALPWIALTAVILPKALSKAAYNSAFEGDMVNNGVKSRILHGLLESGCIDNNTKKIVKNHERRYKNIAEIIDSQLGDYIEFDKYMTGISFWLKLKKGNSLSLADYCAKNGVLITPGSMYAGNYEDSKYFRLCHIGADDHRLIEGIGIIKKGLKQPG